MFALWTQAFKIPMANHMNEVDVFAQTSSETISLVLDRHRVVRVCFGLLNSWTVLTGLLTRWQCA